jgi:DNA-binding MarR family transcriptional regulator
MERGKEASARPASGFFRLHCVSCYDIIATQAGSGHDTISGMKKLTLSDYQALAEFRYRIRRFLHFSEQVVKKAGLERGQYQLLLAIKGMPAGVRPRIRELANRMDIRHHSAVELVNRLEAGGFVERTRAQDDRREVLLALTPKGEKVLAELALHHHDELRSAGPELVGALRRVMREGNDASPQHSAPALDKARNSKHP